MMNQQRIIKFLDKAGLIGATLLKDDNGNYVLKAGKKQYLHKDWNDIVKKMNELSQYDKKDKDRRIVFVCDDCTKTETCEKIGQSDEQECDEKIKLEGEKNGR